jgi:CspA family cold shock protein
MTASPMRSCISRAVERAGMSNLNEGDRLDFDIEVDQRGKYAAVNLQSKAD